MLVSFGNSSLLDFGTAILVRYATVVLVLGADILVGSAHKVSGKFGTDIFRTVSHNWDPAPLGIGFWLCLVQSQSRGWCCLRIESAPSEMPLDRAIACHFSPNVTEIAVVSVAQLIRVRGVSLGDNLWWWIWTRTNKRWWPLSMAGKPNVLRNSFLGLF